MATCALVGTWRAAPRFTNGSIVDVDCSETFSADGKWVGVGSCGGHDLNLSWTLIDDRGDRVTIRMNEFVVGMQERTFAFESPDLIREEGGLFPGSKFKRVTSPVCDLPMPDTRLPSQSPK